MQKLKTKKNSFVLFIEPDEFESISLFCYKMTRMMIWVPSGSHSDEKKVSSTLVRFILRLRLVVFDVLVVAPLVLSPVDILKAMTPTENGDGACGEIQTVFSCAEDGFFFCGKIFSWPGWMLENRGAINGNLFRWKWSSVIDFLGGFAPTFGWKMSLCHLSWNVKGF